jgi:phosphodiesterase/alkaline phosphatase D-like protein
MLTPRSRSTIRQRGVAPAAWLLLALAATLASTSSSSLVTAQGGSCTPPTGNPIQCENWKPGNPASEWEVVGAGDPTIQGFTTDISVDQGQTVTFKVSTPANAYRLDIYRLGYYAGLGARKVATVMPSVSLPQNQPACVSDATTGLVDCGNWAASASWAVPADAVSGVYLAKAIRTDTGGASHIIFIVRDDNGNSDLLFQTSDATWHAYNSYGGNSFYTGSPAGRAYKLSYNRPFNNRDLGGGVRESFLFSSEYPMLRWLEANGYNVSYFTNVDTQRRGGEILEHKAFLSVGHDEYWSGEMRTAVEGARGAGVNLAFFTANEVFWKTRWESSIAGASTPNRTLVSYKETHANAKIDPQANVWTGTWRDPRFSPPADGGRPENALTGQLFMVNGIRNDAISVPAEDGRLRFWRNTSIATLPLGQVADLPTGTLGYEWDVDVDNGFRPAGLIRMSSTTVNVNGQYLLDYGSNYGTGTATHALTLYKHSSGALVFGAGTVQWSWGLDVVHDGSGAPADSRMQQATINLLADMDAQPLTLQPGLVLATKSTDTVAAIAAVTSPASGASLEVGHAITITGTATDSAGRVAAIEVSTDGGATWHPATGRENWSYSATFTQLGSTTIRARAVDDSGNIQVSPTLRTFNVIPDTTAPAITNVAVASAFSTWASVTWTTNEPADGQAQYGLTTSYGNTTTLETALSTTHVGQLYGLQPSTTYHFRVMSRDSAGNLSTSGDFTVTTTSATAVQVLTFDEPPGEEQPFDGQYPTGVIDWGSGQWWHSAPYGGFATKSISFLGSGTSIATMTFINPIRMLRIDAYNDGDTSATVSVSCPTQATVQAAVPAGQVRTIATGWTQTCSSATLSSTNGWQTNFDNLEFDTPPDSAPPVISGVGTEIGSVTTTIGWTTNEPADGQVEYGLSPSYGSSSPVNPALTTGHSITLTGLQPNTTYYYRVRSRDIAGNLGTSAGDSFTTDPPDVTPPTFSSIQTTLVTDTSARVTWLTNENADTQVDYGLTAAYGTTTPLNTAMSAGHAVALSGLTGGTTYHYRVRSRDASGNLSISDDRTFSTAATGVCPCSVWPLTAVPSVPSQPDSSAVELGMRFRADSDGVITGLRFYKGASNTGMHVANLWSNSGTPLATAVFEFESATGWQEVAFPTPVAITANTTYVASYHAPNGGYAVTSGGLFSTVDSPPLHALRDGLDGPSGVYRYGASGFPASTFGSTNYWVDVVFAIVPDTTGPAFTNIGAAVTSTAAMVTWTTNEPADSRVEYGLTTSYGSMSPLSSTLTTSHSIGLSGLTASTLYHYRVLSRDALGNPSASADMTFTTAPPDLTPPVVSNILTSLVTSSSARVSWTTDEIADTQVDYGLTTAYGTTTPLDTLLTTGHASELTGLNAATTYHYRVRSRDASGNLTVSPNQTFTTLATGACPCSVWPVTTTPAVASTADSNPIEVGMRFRGTQDGFIAGLRFYKGAANTGLHVAHLWTNTGTLLATATFVNETASGWQEVMFASPVPVSANTTYVASYFAPVGRYAQNLDGLAGTVSAPPLQALGNGVDGANGVFLYGTSGFPTSSFQSSNYWVDVVFVPGADVTAPTISAVAATPATPASSTATVTWTTSEPADSRVEYGLTTSYGSLSPLSSTLTMSHSIGLSGLTASTLYHYRVLSRDAAGNLSTSADMTFTTAAPDLTPPVVSNIVSSLVTSSSARVSWTTDEIADTQVDYGLTTAYGSSTVLDALLTTGHAADLTGLSPATLYHYRVRSRDASGNPTVSTDRTFTTLAAGACPCSVWPVTTTPAVASTTDSNPIEVGMRFRATQNGVITGLRFYKGAANTGTHVGHLWTNTGTLLATATFVDETASGWQEVMFASPVAIVANTTYVASYFAPVGRYAQNLDGLAATVSAPPLQALGNGVDGANGVYFYGSSGGFPTSSFQASNYWVDVLFIEDVTPPVITAVVATPALNSSTVTWTTNEAADGQVEYGTSPSFGTLSTLVTALTTPHSITLTGLTANTTYYFRVRSRDAAGNLATSTSSTFETLAPDTTPPVITAVVATPTVNSATVTWTTNEAADGQVEYAATLPGEVSTLVTALTTPHSITLTGLTPNTTYYYRVRSRDAAGNLALSTILTFRTLTPDTTPPVITAVVATPASNSSTVTWTTNEAADGQVEYGTSPSFGTLSTLVTALTTPHSITVTGLTANTTYYFRVRSRDAAGNLATSATSTFSTDVTAPVITAVVATPAANSATVTWTTNEAANGQVEYGTSPSFGTLSTLVTALTTPHSITLTGLATNTTYYFRVRSRDAAGNLATSTSSTFRTDSTPPVITAVVATPAVNSATVTWTTNEAANGQVEYGTSSSLGTLSTLVTALTTPHSITLTGLTANRTYYFRVRSRDAAGNLATSTTTTFRTLTPDTTPPTLSNVQPTFIAQTSARVSWTSNEPANTQVEYGLSAGSYTSSTTLDSTLATSHIVQLNGLTANTTYYFRVRSRDAANNLATATGSFRTAATGACPCSIFALTATPATASADDTSAVELGVKFRSSQSGYIHGIRFYKGPTNTGVHVAHLWTASGTLRATATFTNETATGWQEVKFATPIAITANTTYVASYYAPNGGYAFNENFFTANVSAPPLTALASTTSAPNGVYRVGSSGFPTLGFNASNGWVDVVFRTTP